MLMAMHMFAVLAQTAGVFKYSLPVSDTSCKVTNRLFIVFNVLYDVRGGYYMEENMFGAGRVGGWRGQG